jgi:hypothetical protein
MQEIFDKGRLTWHVNLLSDSAQEPEVSFKRHAAHPLHLTSFQADKKQNILLVGCLRNSLSYCETTFAGHFNDSESL